MSLETGETGQLIPEEIVQEKGKMISKYESGVNNLKEEWHNEKLRREAEEMGEFYLNNIEIDVPPGEIALVHFTTDINISRIDWAEKKELKDTSPFYDCDRGWLKQIGVDIDKLDEKFKNQPAVVAIPLEHLKKWVGTLSWFKLYRAGALNNAIIFTVPQNEVMLRNHKFGEDLFIKGMEGIKDDSLMKKYYESTTGCSDEVLKEKDFMAEAWIPYQVDLEKCKIVKYSNK